MFKGGFFITGTDTGVGKTLLATALIRYLRVKGYSICPIKPVETGCIERDGILIPQDGQILLEASEAEVSLKDVVPFMYKAPVAPMVAAELEERPFSAERFLKTFEEYKERFNYLVLEGAGGIMVPLNSRLFTIDLIEMTGLPVIVVAANKLGVINHTLLSVEALKRRGITVVGVVLNNTSPMDDDISRQTNRQVLSRLLDVAVLGEMPYLSKKDMKSLYEALVRFLDLSGLP